MFDNENRYIINNYQRLSEFASFLPGIAGPEGVPLWAFYVNRGQALCSFGTQDREHSIMEWRPAQQACQMVSTLGFRTFLKIRGNVMEPFRDPHSVTAMHVGMNELEIEDHSFLGLIVRVLYFILPGEQVSGLVRRVEITNNTDREMEMALLDGLPVFLPAGLSVTDYKERGQSAKARMTVEGAYEKTPYFYLRGSAEGEGRGGNYFLAVSEDGELLQTVTDPACVFGMDTGFTGSGKIAEDSVEEILGGVQITENIIPCAFTGCRLKVGKGESRYIYEIYGHARDRQFVTGLSNKCMEAGFFENKLDLARQIGVDLTTPMDTSTGDPVFNAYCRQTFLDNILRGGAPVSLTGDGKNLYYIYGRTNGDLERDYRRFKIPAQAYSHGGGSFRDVIQNRRMDAFFFPETGDMNIRLFADLIQLDGYNPNILNATAFRMKDPECVMSLIGEKLRPKARKFLSAPFTPGEICSFYRKQSLKEKGIISCVEEEFLRRVIENSTAENTASFGDGYWSDHWIYLSDLIDSYLRVHPERTEELFYGEPTYTWHRMERSVLPRARRYEETEQGIRQTRFLEEIFYSEESSTGTVMVGGLELKSTLLGKLLVLALCKFANLDMEQLGLEMEGGRPGWCDALDALPACFGSSVSDSMELVRLVRNIRDLTARFERSAELPEEAALFWERIAEALVKYGEPAGKDKKERLQLWEECNLAKEAYRESLVKGITGNKRNLNSSRIRDMLDAMLLILEDGAKRSASEGNGIPASYCLYEVGDFRPSGESVHLSDVTRKDLPLFLEGPIHAMRILETPREKKQLYASVRDSELYDRDLEMYRYCGSLKDTADLGTVSSLVQGWRENGSIWLHAEYKYLLELLKAGFYEEFLWDFRRACIPFLQEETYGRSLLENSSFIVSSAYPIKKFHGKGIVSRLTGSAAEFLEIWEILMFGRNPVTVDASGQRAFTPAPFIPEYLIGDNLKVGAVFLGKTPVTYRLAEKKDYEPGTYRIVRTVLRSVEGTETIEGSTIPAPVLRQMEEGKLLGVEIELK